MLFLDNFSYRITGDSSKPKLVFLHGLMGYAANFRSVTAHFEEDYHILAYDQRGHGNSFQPEKGYSPDDYADDLKRIIEEIGWTKITLVGHSLGGRIALNFAFRMPQYVEKLVIEDIGPSVDLASIRRFQVILEKVPTPFKSKREAKEYLLNDFNDPILGQFLYSNIKEKADGTCDWRFFKKGIVQSLMEGRKAERWHEIEGLKIPTLVIRGEMSEELPHAHYEKMIAMNKLIKGVVIKNAAHWVHFEQKDKFIDALKDFLT